MEPGQAPLAAAFQSLRHPTMPVVYYAFVSSPVQEELSPFLSVDVRVSPGLGRIVFRSALCWHVHSLSLVVGMRIVTRRPLTWLVAELLRSSYQNCLRILSPPRYERDANPCPSGASMTSQPHTRPHLQAHRPDSPPRPGSANQSPASYRLPRRPSDR